MLFIQLHRELGPTSTVAQIQPRCRHCIHSKKNADTQAKQCPSALREEGGQGCIVLKNQQSAGLDYDLGGRDAEARELPRPPCPTPADVNFVCRCDLKNDKEVSCASSRRCTAQPCLLGCSRNVVGMGSRAMGGPRNEEPPAYRGLQLAPAPQTSNPHQQC